MAIKRTNIAIITLGLLLIGSGKQAHAQISTYRVIDDNGISQIAYEKDGVQKIITNEKFAHADPITNEKAIVYSAQSSSLWQLYYYDISANYTIQLTRYGNNVNPQFSGKNVFWEGQRNGAWQILMFDGIKITQLTNSQYPTQDLEIKDNLLTYSQKNKNNEWHIYLYDINSEKTIPVEPELKGQAPEIYDNTVTWQTTDKTTGKTTFYTYDLDEGDTFYENKTTGRKKYITELERKLKELSITPTKKTKAFKRTIVKAPEQEPEPEEVEIEDIIEELNIEKVKKTKVEVIEEVKETTESTTSNQ